MNGHYEGNIPEYLEALGNYLLYTYNIVLDYYEPDEFDSRITIELAQFSSGDGSEDTGGLLKSQYIYPEDTEDFEEKVIEGVKEFMAKSSEQINKEEDEKEALEVQESINRAKAAGNDHLANLLQQINNDILSSLKTEEENEDNQSEG